MYEPGAHSWNQGQGCGQSGLASEALDVQAIPLPPRHPAADCGRQWSFLLSWHLWSPLLRPGAKGLISMQSTPGGMLLASAPAPHCALCCPWHGALETGATLGERRVWKEGKRNPSPPPCTTHPHTSGPGSSTADAVSDKYLHASIYSPVKWGEEHLLSSFPLSGKTGEQREPTGLNRSQARPILLTWELPALAEYPTPILSGQDHVGGC